ncbi:MAG: hypothetical protein MR601_06980 [Erysipelotrichaceae bacterium]|nr:hypothetical protein [Erysipelotrichaceae bacterium]
MDKYYLDSNTLLGRIVYKNENDEVVHLSLKKGNEVPEYSNNSVIILFLIDGKIQLNTDEKTILYKNEMVRLTKNVKHSIIALEDSQILAVKIY